MKNNKTPLASFSEFQREHSLTSEIPYWECMDDLIVLADGTLVTCCKINGISIETLDEHQVNHLTLDLRSLLNSLPDDFEITFSQEVNSKADVLLNKHGSQKGSNSDVNWITESRVQNLMKKISEKRILNTELYLTFYRRFQQRDQVKKKSFFTSPKKFNQVTRKVHEQARKELSQIQHSVTSALSGMGIETYPLQNEELLSRIYTFLNSQRAESVSLPQISTKYREQEFSPAELSMQPALSIPTLREQLVFRDLIQGYNSFFLDGLYHQCITLKSLPEFTHSALISKLSGLPFHYQLDVHVKVPEQSKELSSLQMRRKMAHSMSINNDGRASDLESEAKLNSTEELLRELINTGQKILYSQLSVLIRASTEDELKMRTRTILTRLRELNGCEGMEESVGNLRIWKNMLPMGNLNMTRPKRIKTDNLADLLPVYQAYQGPKDDRAKPVCLFQNRGSELVSYDPYYPGLPNYNTLVTGSSGAGKSFINNIILLQYMSQDPMLYIIDIGGSYRKLSSFLNGQYIEISPPKKGEDCTVINPLQLANETEPSPQKVKFLLAMLEKIFTDEGSSKLSKLHKSLLEEAIIRTYERKKGSSPTLSNLRKTLEDSEENALHDFAKMLFPWTGDRPYGRLLDGQNQFDLKNDVVVFDLKGLSSYPDLQTVMILIITDFILGRVESSDEAIKKRPKRILMDEAWECLKDPASSQFMEYCVRTLRKTGSGITFITQGLDEIVSSPIGNAILSNTATKFILLQRGDLEPMKRILKLNDHEISLIQSLRQEKGHYSEAFLIANDDRTVIRVCPTPVEYWLATSDAKDNSYLSHLLSTYPEKTIAEHIFDAASKYPFGSSNGLKQSA